MPRRPAKIERDIPLWLIPGMVKRGVSVHGVRLKRVIVWETRGHFYNISIRTKPIRKDRKGRGARCRDEEPLERDPQDTRPENSTGSEPE
jgi:hypothetical protein